jgi:hypothetical protein
MRTPKFLTIGIFLSSTLFFSQCEVQRVGCTDPKARNYDVAADIDDNSCLYGVDPLNGDCSPDTKGNLSVTNQTDQVLYLYKDFALITCIPANAEEFIVSIANEGLTACKLQIWKAESVSDIYDPDISNVYRQWSVALSNTDNINERSSWLITDDQNYAGSGTINLTYPDIDEYGQSVIYQVDVFLNSKSGAKLASLQPGVINKKVSVDYGVHYLFFRYWYSDPNSTTGDITELGWNQNSELVINAAFETADVTIPFFYSNVGKYGELKVYNEMDNLISIYANDALIETISKLDGSTQGLSIIPAQNATTFLIPAKSYTITAKSVSGTDTYTSFRDIDIIQNEQATKWVGIEHQTISISNNTEQTLLLYSLDDEYLGVTIAAGESSGAVLVPSSFDSVMVITGTKTHSKVLETGVDVTVNELNNYERNELNITESWNVIGENHFRSPAIDHNQETSMTAVLINDIEATISFEYLVSSESNWDYFRFTIDGETIISKESGEVAWTSFSKTLSPGTHTLVWKYIKDDRITIGNDYVEIKNIVTE